MEELEIRYHPHLEHPAMVLGFTGWMDGGSVSTGTVGYLVDRLGANLFAEIKPFDFYLFDFPISTIPLSLHTEEGQPVLDAVNPMEVAAIFRPHTKIEDGIIKELRFPRSEFYVAERANVILFSGDEPHLRWGSYCDHLFRVAEEFGVTEMYFIGSVAAAVPHTREPRMHASVASEELKARLAGLGVGYGNYEGPASITTALSHFAGRHGVEFRSLVVEVPHYPLVDMPAYPRSILKTTAALDELLSLGLDLRDLQRASETVEEKLNDLARENDGFRELVGKLESAYDQEEFGPDADVVKRLMEGIDPGEFAGEN